MSCTSLVRWTQGEKHVRIAIPWESQSIRLVVFRVVATNLLTSSTISVTCNSANTMAIICRTTKKHETQSTNTTQRNCHLQYIILLVPIQELCQSTGIARTTDILRVCARSCTEWRERRILEWQHMLQDHNIILPHQPYSESRKEANQDENGGRGIWLMK